MLGVWHWKHFSSSTSLPGASGKPTAATGLPRCASAGAAALSSAIRTRERYIVVFGESRQHQEIDRGIAAVGDEVRAAGLGGERLAGREADLFLRILQEDAQVALQHVEGVADLVVIVPGHFLRGRKLQLLDAEARAFGEPRTVLDFVEVTGVLQCFHGCQACSLRICRSWKRERKSSAVTAPSSAQNMSFCVSQGSPCVPRNSSAPCP